MKKFSLIITACLALLSFTALAQTNSTGGSGTVQNLMPNPGSNFLSSFGLYFTSSNTNQPVHGKAEIALGAAYQSGINFASDFDVRYKIYNITTNSGIMLESVTRNAGVDGVIVSEEIGAAYFYIPTAAPDIELSAGILGGYRFDKESGTATVYLDARKTLTTNTFAGTRLGYEYSGETAPTSPILTVYWGFML